VVGLDAYTIVSATLLALALGVAPLAQAGAPLELFGVKLHNASRDTLRIAVKKAGLIPERVDSHYFCDKYDVNGQLKGAKILHLCYTSDTNSFAYAEYTFPAFMDTALVSSVISLIIGKYGMPSSQTGNVNLGPVKAVWQKADNMSITVSRGWPDTTTLNLTDITNKNHFDDELQQQEAYEQKQQAKQQSNAF